MGKFGVVTMRKASGEAGPPLLCIVDPSLKDFVGHHFEYDAAVASGGRDMGYEVVCLAHINVQKAVSDVLSVRPAFTYDIWEAQSLHTDQPIEAAYKQANRFFLEDLTRATRDLAIDERAIIFGHMITAAQLKGWAEFAWRTRARRPAIVLLCRYELAHYRGEIATRAFRELEKLQRAGVRIRLATDSARLSKHLSRLTSLPVEVFPIPHTQGHQAVDIRPEWSGQSPLVVSMLGNARDEKGWVELIAAIHILESQGRAQDFRFVVQANNPDAACARALSRLGDHLPGCVELKISALAPRDYAALLETSDIVVLPYWRSIYEARTSGVLVEALSAGKPVICTEETWLSDQVDAGQGRHAKDRNPADLARQLWAMRTDYPQYAAAARKARETWVMYHNPANFALALVRGGRLIAPNGLRVALLYPWGDAQTKASGASLRLNLLARYLSRRVESVTVLEDARHASKTIEGIRFEAYPLLEQGDDSELGRRFRRWLPNILKVSGGEELYFLLHIYPGRNRAFRRHLEEVVRSCDVVFLEYPFWAPVLAPICRKLGKPIIITAHDVVADQVRSSRILRELTAQLELHGLRQARSVAVVSEADQTAFARRGVRTTVIRQFVDVDSLRAMPKVDRTVLNRLIDLPEDDKCALFVFIGSRFRPNEVAATHLREIATSTRSVYPHLSFRIIVAGSCCPAIREDAFIALGHVGEAVLSILYQHATMIAIPLTLGTGASLKTVEAFGAGAPVLGTSVAFRGLDFTPGVGCIVEDDLSVWPDRIEELTRDPAISNSLRVGAVEGGNKYNYLNTCDTYLSLAPEIVDVVSSGARKESVNLSKPVLALIQAGWNTGLSEIITPYLEELRLIDPNNNTLAQIHAELLSNGSRLDAVRAARLFQEVFEVGGEPEPCLYGFFKTSERLGDSRIADQTLRLAVRLFTLHSAHQDGDAAVREALWKRFHAGERAWVRAIAREIALLAGAVHTDYHYLFSLLEIGDGANHELGLTHAEIALAAGFNRYWSLSLIARHQAALGRTSDAMQTLSEATEAANDEEQRRAIIDARLVIIWALFHKGEWMSANNEAVDLLEYMSELPGAYYIRAECRRLLGNPAEECIADYDRAESLGYDPIWCRLHSGRLLTDARRFNESAQRLKSVFAGLEDSHQLQCWRDGIMDIARSGVGHMNLEDLRTIVTEAVRNDPSNNDLKVRLDQLGPSPLAVRPALRRDHLEKIVGSNFQLKDYRLVLAQAQEANVIFADEPIFCYYVAECLQILGESLDVADDFYSRAIDLSMEAFWPLMNRGQLRRKRARFEDAHKDLQAALESARDQSERALAVRSLRDLESDYQGSAS